MSLLLLIIVLLIVFGGLPQVSGHNFGYGPSGIGRIILLILLIMLLTGRLWLRSDAADRAILKPSGPFAPDARVA